MTNTLSLTCSQCGGKIEIRGTSPKVKCSYCGTEQILSPEIQAMMKDESWVVCPVCKRNDRMEKVTAVVIHGYYGNNAVLSSQLTLKEPEYYDLTPPKLENIEFPSLSQKSVFAFISLLNFVLASILFFTSNKSEEILCRSIACIWGFLCLFPLINLPEAIREERQRDELLKRIKQAEQTESKAKIERMQELKKWEIANEQMQKRHNLKMKVWDDMYYCFRDDVVCLPADGLSARVGDMEKFVNWYVDNKM